MSTATARKRATAYVAETETGDLPAWSGCLDPEELNRPGGLLIAALMQCAKERGLSTNGLASALGVSYWSLSQLRIGFRPVEMLDEVMVTGCARFLGLSPLLVRLLAGLMDVAEVMAAPALGAQDIMHVRQVMAREPADLCLLPAPHPARPLQALVVDELAELYREHGQHARVCEALRVELAQRPMSRTEWLRSALAVQASGPVASEAAVLRCGGCQQRLRVPRLAAPGEIRCPSCSTEYAVHWQGAVCLVQSVTSDVPDDDAVETDPANDLQPWAVLGLDPDSAWDQVEKARRSLLQQYHPDRLGHVSPLVHQLAEEAFKRVSDAYDTLKARR